MTRGAGDHGRATWVSSHRKAAAAWSGSGGGCGGTMDVASFLKKIGDVLSERRTSARELDARKSGAAGRDVSIRVRSTPHGSLYPSLADIRASIGRPCHDQKIALPQLSRIAFLSDEVRV